MRVPLFWLILKGTQEENRCAILEGPLKHSPIGALQKVDPERRALSHGGVANGSHRLASDPPQTKPTCLRICFITPLLDSLCGNLSLDILSPFFSQGQLCPWVVGPHPLAAACASFEVWILCQSGSCRLKKSRKDSLPWNFRCCVATENTAPGISFSPFLSFSW